MKPFHSLLRCAIVAAICIFAFPVTAAARNPWFTISVFNPSRNYEAHITIYSLGKVRIEASGRSTWSRPYHVSSGLFTLGSYHHVRYEWMDRNGRTVCDTSIQIVLKLPGGESSVAARTRGYYEGGSHCHIDDLGPASSP